MRTYPNRALASNVVGFVNGEGKGSAGLEGLLDSQLAGTPGQEVYEHSTYGRIPLGTNVLTPPVNGINYSLTLDADLQWFSEQALADGIAKAGAKTGSILVMNPNTARSSPWRRRRPSTLLTLGPLIQGTWGTAP